MGVKIGRRSGVNVVSRLTAWDVMTACQGELRLAPSGHVISIDMDAALKIGAARGCDLALLSELLPAAEAGLVEALCIEKGRPD
jgi:hypothetical protein